MSRRKIDAEILLHNINEMINEGKADLYMFDKDRKKQEEKEQVLYRVKEMIWEMQGKPRFEVWVVNNETGGQITKPIILTAKNVTEARRKYEVMFPDINTGFPYKVEAIRVKEGANVERNS